MANRGSYGKKQRVSGKVLRRNEYGTVDLGKKPGRLIKLPGNNHRRVSKPYSLTKRGMAGAVTAGRIAAIRIMATGTGIGITGRRVCRTAGRRHSSSISKRMGTQRRRQRQIDYHQENGDGMVERKSKRHGLSGICMLFNLCKPPEKVNRVERANTAMSVADVMTAGQRSS